MQGRKWRGFLQLEFAIVSIGKGGTWFWIPVEKKPGLVKKKKKEETLRSQSAQRKKHMSQQSRPSI